MSEIFEHILAGKKSNCEFAICIITNTKGSVPREAGAKMLVYPDGKIIGTIGGGRIERKVIEDALITLDNRKPKLYHYDLLKDLQMSCGGNLDIYIEPVMKKNKLFIFGAGHTGAALVKLLKNFDFELTLIDNRADYIQEIEMGDANKLCGEYEHILPTLPYDGQTYICIMTYGHKIDQQILAYCLKQPHAYLGMMGSHRKVELTKKLFIEEGLASIEELNKVNMPIGIEIGAEGPDEIAISILAKILSIKNKTEVL